MQFFNQSKSVSKPIPLEISPYLTAIFPQKQKQQWLIEFYWERVVPYVDYQIKHNTAWCRSVLQKSLILKFYFTHQNQYNLFKDSSLLSLQLENAFFKFVASSYVSFDTFLPENYQRHLHDMLTLQMLVTIRDELLSSSDPISKTKQYKDLQFWVHKELQANHISQPKSQNQFNLTNYYHPSLLLYFFNGSNRIFTFFQLEYFFVRKVYSNWYRWACSLENYDNITIHNLFLLLLSTVKFVADCIFVAAVPYRLIRTIVNELSHYLYIHIHVLLLEKLPYYNSKNKYWIIFNCIFQICLYSVILWNFGLSMMPIPLSWIPTFFISSNVWFLGVAYLSSIMISSMILKTCKSFFEERIEKEEKNWLEHIQEQHLEKREDIFITYYTPSYHLFSQKYQSPFRSSLDPLSEHPERIRIKPKI